LAGYDLLKYGGVFVISTTNMYLENSGEPSERIISRLWIPTKVVSTGLMISDS